MWKLVWSVWGLCSTKAVIFHAVFRPGHVFIKPDPHPIEEFNVNYLELIVWGEILSKSDTGYGFAQESFNDM